MLGGTVNLDSKLKRPWLWRRPAGEAEESGFSQERVAGSNSSSRETDSQPRQLTTVRRERLGGGTGAGSRAGSGASLLAPSHFRSSDHSRGPRPILKFGSSDYRQP